MEKFFKQLKLALLAVASLGSVVAAVSVTTKPAYAGFFCGDLGTGGMGSNALSTNTRNSVLQEVGGRKYSITDLFPPSASSYSVPRGNNKEHWLFYAGNNKVEEGIGTKLTEDQKKRLDAHGQTIMCTMYGFQPAIQNVTKSLATFVAGMIEGIVSLYFKTDLFCEPNSAPNSMCIDMLGVIGGQKGGDGGIIGRLGNGIFMPFIIFAFICVAMWLLYTGIIQRQFRASINGLLWSLFAFAMGIFVITVPWIVAQAPQTINTAIAQCILEAATGNACASSSGSNNDKFNDPTCTTQGAGNGRSDAMQIRLSALSCVITKAFVVDRWAEQQFGYQFNQLYTQDAPAGNQVYPADKLQGSPGDYCVNMYSASSPQQIRSQQKPAFSNASGGRVCNIAVAYMANRVQGDFGTTAKMEHIVATAAKDEIMWGAMTGDGRDITGFAAIASTIAAGVSFLPVAIYGMAYNLTSSLLIMFAPVFLLIGVVPGRGRSIFLGWLESLLSAFLKFFVSGLLLVIMIVVYSAVMSRLPGFSSLIVSIILCFTFMSYRKEMMNLLGVVNMGGVKLTNRVGNFLENKVDGVGKSAKKYAGSFVGGAVGSGSIVGGLEGMRDQFKKNRMRGGGFTASALRSAENLKNKNSAAKAKYNRDLQAEQHRLDVKAGLLGAKGSMFNTNNGGTGDGGENQGGHNNQNNKNKQKIDGYKNDGTRRINQFRNNRNRIAVLDPQLANLGNKLNNASTVEGAKHAHSMVINMLNQAGILNGLLNHFGGDAQKSKNAYINNFEQDGLNKLNQLEEGMMNKFKHDPEKVAQLQAFFDGYRNNNLSEEKQKLIEAMDVKRTEDGSQFSAVDLEALNTSSNFNNDLEKAVNALEKTLQDNRDNDSNSGVQSCSSCGGILLAGICPSCRHKDSTINNLQAMESFAQSKGFNPVHDENGNIMGWSKETSSGVEQKMTLEDMKVKQEVNAIHEAFRSNDNYADARGYEEVKDEEGKILGYKDPNANPSEPEKLITRRELNEQRQIERDEVAAESKDNYAATKGYEPVKQTITAFGDDGKPERQERIIGWHKDSDEEYEDPRTGQTVKGKFVKDHIMQKSYDNFAEKHNNTNNNES